MNNCFWVVVLMISSIQCKMTQKDKENPVSTEGIIALDTLPSVSGLAVTDDAAYIVGDDSPWLFKYTRDLRPLDKFLLVKGFVLEGRIPKALKPDFECMAQIQERGITNLLIFGSGSKTPERDLLIKVNVQEPQNPQILLLTPFYDHIVSLSGGTRADLNMEAALVSGKELYLFNRADNRIYVTDWYVLLAALNPLSTEEAVPLPDIRQYKIDLPELEGVKAGFSGACSLPGHNRILFTATIEDTENWIADGEVLGSYLGVLDLSSPEQGKLVNIALVPGKDGRPLKDKLESVDIMITSENGDMKLLAVADNDDGTSLLLELRVKASFWKEGE